MFGGRKLSMQVNITMFKLGQDLVPHIQNFDSK